jgi:hypothetical protein
MDKDHRPVFGGFGGLRAAGEEGGAICLFRRRGGQARGVCPALAVTEGEKVAAVPLCYTNRAYRMRDHLTGPVSYGLGVFRFDAIRLSSHGENVYEW